MVNSHNQEQPCALAVAVGDDEVAAVVAAAAAVVVAACTHTHTHTQSVCTKFRERLRQDPEKRSSSDILYILFLPPLGIATIMLPHLCVSMSPAVFTERWTRGL